MSSFKKLLATKLRDPEIRAAYEDAQRRRRLIKELVEARREQLLTQTDVARRMGVGQSTVAGFEAGQADPRIGTLQRYARAVNRRLDVFVTTPADVRFAERLDQGTSYSTAWARGGQPVVGTLKTPGESTRADFATAA